MTTEEETFVKELAQRAKAENAFPRVTPPTNTGQQNAPHMVVVSTKVGNVSVLGEEKNNLDAVSAREGKSSTELINQYL